MVLPARLLFFKYVFTILGIVVASLSVLFYVQAKKSMSAIQKYLGLVKQGYGQYPCVTSNQLVSVPSEADSAKAVSLVLNYTTAYQMLHRCAHIKSGESILIHSAASGVGTTLLQLGNLVGLDMYSTCSARKEKVVSELGYSANRVAVLG